MTIPSGRCTTAPFFAAFIQGASSHCSHRARDVGHLDMDGEQYALLLADAEPEMPECGLADGDGREVVADMLVLAGNLAVVATDAFVQIDCHCIYVMCYTSPSHFSTSTRHEPGAIPEQFLDRKRATMSAGSSSRSCQPSSGRRARPAGRSRRRTVGVDDARLHPLGDGDDAQHGAPVVPDLDDVAALMPRFSASTLVDPPTQYR